MELAMRVHNLTAKGMEFTIMETLHASTVEMWLHTVVPRRRTDQMCGLGLQVHHPSR
jgi:NADH:ubiquinone oxidoreductase subunit H